MQVASTQWPVGSGVGKSAQFILDLAQSAQYGLVVILAGPGVARDPAPAGLFRPYLSRVRMRGVVVDGAHDHAARPGSDSGQRRALEFAGLIARFHIFHFAVLSIGDPSGKDLQLGEVADWRNAAEIEAGVARALLDPAWKVGEQLAWGLWMDPGEEANTFGVSEYGRCFPQELKPRCMWVRNGAAEAAPSSNQHLGFAGAAGCGFPGGGGEVLDPVAAVLLGRIEAGVGVIQQRFRFVVSVASRDGASHTHCDESLLARTNHRCSAHAFAQFAGAQESVR